MSELRRGDIFFADLGHKCRPYLVVQNDIGNVCNDRTIVVPLTSKIRRYPMHCVVSMGIIRPSAVQCEEIMCVTVDDGWKAVEHLPKKAMRRVDKALKCALGLE